MKHSFFHDVDLLELSPLHRLLFAGLWTVADRDGRLEDRPRQIKHDVLPMDDCDVDGMLNDLKEKHFIDRYVSGETGVIEIVNFDKHQHPHPKEPSTELPDRDEPCNYTARNLITRPSPEITVPAGLLAFPSVTIPSVTVTVSRDDVLTSDLPIEERLDSDVESVHYSDSEEIELPDERRKSKTQTWSSKDQSNFWSLWVRRTGQKKPHANIRKQFNRWLDYKKPSEAMDALNGYGSAGMLRHPDMTIGEFKARYGEWLQIDRERAERSPTPPPTPSPSPTTISPSPIEPSASWGPLRAIARWNEIVISNPVTWDASHDNQKQLKKACDDQLFRDRFDEICNKAEAMASAGNKSRHFRWMIKPAFQSEIGNWWDFLNHQEAPKFKSQDSHEEMKRKLIEKRFGNGN